MRHATVWVLVLVVGMVVMVAMAQQPQGARRGAPDEGAGAGLAAANLPRTISVTGTALTKTAPDIIIWNIQLMDQDADLQAAKQANDAKLERIFALRKELQLEAGDLETGHVRIRREYERDEHGRQGEFKHFVVSRQVTVRQRNLKRFDEFLDHLVASAEMEVSFSYDSTRLHVVRAQTRLDAAKIAQKKAADMAKALGAQLGPVLEINEHRPDGGSRWQQPMMAQNAMRFDPGSQPTVDLAAGKFAPGAIDVQVTVYTTFLLK